MGRALIIVDVQHDFLPGGSLAVEDGNRIIPVINDLRTRVRFDCVVVSKDWHPADHCSFHENNPGSSLFQPFRIFNDKLPKEGLDQMMWPTHCVQGSYGAELHPDLVIEDSDLIICKGLDKDIDSYSAFWDVGKLTQTSLAKDLRSRGITEVFCCGLAEDYCVNFTALDAQEEGFKTAVIQDATRGVAKDSVAAAHEQWAERGIDIVMSADIL